MLEAEHREAVVQGESLSSRVLIPLGLEAVVGSPKDRDAERACSARLRICLRQIFGLLLEVCICDSNHFSMLQIQQLPSIPPLEFPLNPAEVLPQLRPGTSPHPSDLSSLSSRIPQREFS